MDESLHAGLPEKFKCGAKTEASQEEANRQEAYLETALEAPEAYITTVVANDVTANDVTDNDVIARSANDATTNDAAIAAEAAKANPQTHPKDAELPSRTDSEVGGEGCIGPQLQQKLCKEVS